MLIFLGLLGCLASRAASAHVPPSREQMAKQCAALKERVELPASRDEEAARRSKTRWRSLDVGYRYALERPVLIRSERLNGDEAPGLRVQWTAMAVLEADCGDGWMLVSVPYLDRFFAGYLRRGPVANEPQVPDLCRNGLVRREEAFISAWSDPSKMEGPLEPMFVLSSAAVVRSAPNRTAPAVMKLAYGVPVDFVSNDCVKDWSLIALPGSFGYIARDEASLGPALLSNEELVAKVREARSMDEKAFWALQRSHREAHFPSAEIDERAMALQQEARRSPESKKNRLCETFFGSCEVLAYDNDLSKLDPAKRPPLEDVPLGPWWILPSATEEARPAVFRAARIRRSGECNCCGCESCQIALEVELEEWGTPGRAARKLGASRNPPTSWFQPVSASPCANPSALDRVVSSDARWKSMLAAVAADELDRGTPSKPRCLPSSDGSAWWTLPWGEDDTDWPVYLSAQIKDGKVVRTEGREPVAARDLDGDGEVDLLWKCPYGELCTAETERVRSGP